VGIGQIVAWGLLGAAVVAFTIYRQPVMAASMRMKAYLQDVRTEIKKVTWPDVAELKRSTTVIVIFVLILGVVIGIMDWAFSKILIDGLGGLFS
jgi:preprotein translocase subunit SecE